MEPRPNLLLSDPAMSQLRSAASAYLDAPSPIHRQELERLATRHAGQQAGALAHLVLGYSALQAKEFDAAVRHLRAGRGASSVVSDYFEYLLAGALRSLGRHAEAAEVLQGFEQRYPNSSLMSRAVLARAESWIETGRWSASAEVLLARLGALDRPRADMLLGRAYAAGQDWRSALRAYRQAYYLYPTSDDAAEAEREIERLSRRLEGATPAAPAALRKERAERLFQARQFRAAQEAYRELAAAVGGAEQERALVRAAAAAFRAGSTAAAHDALARLQTSDAAASAERLYYLVECYRRMSRESSLVEAVRQLGERYPDSPWREEALFSTGNYFLLKREYGDSDRYYRAVFEAFPSGKYGALAHWRVTWRRHRAGESPEQKEEARRMFEDHIRRFPKSPQVAAALYWLGRLAEDRQPASATAYYRKASESFPQYFYGTLAREKLNGQLAPAILPDNVSAVVSAILATVPTYRPLLGGAAMPADLAEHRRKVEALEAAWLLDLAVIELRHATEDPTHSQYLMLELARLERDRGRFLTAIEHIRRVFPNYFAFPLESLDRNYWELLFPLPWWSEVREHATRRGLDPYLVAALIRQESAFNPWAVSRANAYGLMQLLPSTARIMARKIGAPQPSRTSLFDPQTNIELGTQYLADVLRRYDGRLEAALASYNAGPHRVDAWLAEDDYADIPEFVESIPFTETREYVQAVIRNVSMYKRLYGKK